LARPGPILKRALRAPAALYAVGAGRLLGHRFLLLVHRGRHSGREYRTMLEVVRWEAARREAVVMSGFGRRSGWYLNSLAGGAEEVRIAGARFRPEVRAVGEEEAMGILADYERRNRLVSPVVRAVLSRLAGFEYDGSPAARRRLVGELPLLAFRDPGGLPRSGWARSSPGLHLEP
jgi:deazaflavin-dependent oxidoreductase (nitroreductase family)